MNTDANIAVMAVELRYIKDAVERIEKANLLVVTRNEWLQRNDYVDRRFIDVDKQFGTIAKETAAKRAPWWSVVTAFAAIAALLITVIPLITK